MTDDRDHTWPDFGGASESSEIESPSETGSGPRTARRPDGAKSLPEKLYRQGDAIDRSIEQLDSVVNQLKEAAQAPVPVRRDAPAARAPLLAPGEGQAKGADATRLSPPAPPEAARTRLVEEPSAAVVDEPSATAP